MAAKKKIQHPSDCRKHCCCVRSLMTNLAPNTGAVRWSHSISQRRKKSAGKMMAEGRNRVSMSIFFFCQHCSRLCLISVWERLPTVQRFFLRLPQGVVPYTHLKNRSIHWYERVVTSGSRPGLNGAISSFFKGSLFKAREKNGATIHTASHPQYVFFVRLQQVQQQPFPNYIPFPLSLVLPLLVFLRLPRPPPAVVSAPAPPLAW